MSIHLTVASVKIPGLKCDQCGEPMDFALVTLEFEKHEKNFCSFECSDLWCKSRREKHIHFDEKAYEKDLIERTK